MFECFRFFFSSMSRRSQRRARRRSRHIRTRPSLRLRDEGQPYTSLEEAQPSTSFEEASPSPWKPLNSPRPTTPRHYILPRKQLCAPPPKVHQPKHFTLYEGRISLEEAQPSTSLEDASPSPWKPLNSPHPTTPHHYILPRKQLCAPPPNVHQPKHFPLYEGSISAPFDLPPTPPSSPPRPIRPPSHSAPPTPPSSPDYMAEAQPFRSTPPPSPERDWREPFDYASRVSTPEPPPPHIRGTTPPPPPYTAKALFAHAVGEIDFRALWHHKRQWHKELARMETWPLRYVLEEINRLHMDNASILAMPIWRPWKSHLHRRHFSIREGRGIVAKGEAKPSSLPKFEPPVPRGSAPPPPPPPPPGKAKPSPPGKAKGMEWGAAVCILQSDHEVCSCIEDLFKPMCDDPLCPVHQGSFGVDKVVVNKRNRIKENIMRIRCLMEIARRDTELIPAWAIPHLENIPPDFSLGGWTR